MQPDQGDILYGTTMIFMKENTMDPAERVSYGKGDYVFRQGASYFYTMLQGYELISGRKS